MGKRNGRRKKKAPRIKNRALRRFIFTLKVSLLVLLTIVLVGGAIFYFTYGKEIMAMQEEARLAVSASTPETFRETETSVVYDNKKKVISELKGAKDVYYLTSDQIPDNVKKAFVSIEDKKFYEHEGVNYSAVIRAVAQRIKNGEFTQGGSTITQQLVRNVFITQEKTMSRKVREMFYAMEMEKKYTKDEILEFYINNIYFSNGFYGIQAASHGYFNKSVDKLSLSQIAFLCAIPNGPTKFDPVTNFDNTLERRNLILKNMLNDGVIMIEEYEASVAEEITLNMKKKKKQDYVETFVRYCAVRALMEKQGFKFRYSFTSDKQKEEYQENYETLYQQCEQSMYSGGYRIYTSISMSKQKKLQNAVNDVLSGFQEKTKDGVYKMQGAAVCINNKTGNVVAIVGGRKQKTEGYTLNRAFQSFRQPGSSIKPLIVYTPAFEKGYTPSSIVDDSQFQGGPRNSDGVYSGRIPIRTAVLKSKNVIAWKLFQELTPKKGLAYLLDMGFSNIVDQDYYPASSLGGLTNGVSPLEMASGYSTIENEGGYRTPTCITKIEDARGNLIYKNRNKERIVYTQESTHMMTSCMESVMQSGGTGASVSLYSMPCAGKTGTTNDKKDGWFCGFTSYYTTAVWVGYDTPQTVSDLYGNTYPGRIWKTFMEELHKNLAYAELHDDYSGQSREVERDRDEDDEPQGTRTPDEVDETEPPEMTEEPIETVKPEETDEWTQAEPVKTEKPVVTEAPQKPVVTEAPPKPVVTEAPPKPAATQAPVPDDEEEAVG